MVWTGKDLGDHPFPSPSSRPGAFKFQKHFEKANFVAWIFLGKMMEREIYVQLFCIDRVHFICRWYWV